MDTYEVLSLLFLGGSFLLALRGLLYQTLPTSTVETGENK